MVALDSEGNSMLRVKKCRMIEMHVCTVYTGTHERIPKYAVVYQAAYVVYIQL